MQEKTENHEDEELLSRLLARRERTDSGCWEWTGARLRGGYGVIRVGDRPRCVHRLVGKLFLHLDDESGLFVLHSCDNPPCFNPGHLRLGTQADNLREAAAKGRMARKLDVERVIEIKRRLAEEESQASIAKAFGVTKENISQIARGVIWKHVNAPAEKRQEKAAA